jgi:hypothetical protein
MKVRRPKPTCRFQVFRLQLFHGPVGACARLSGSLRIAVRSRSVFGQHRLPNGRRPVLPLAAPVQPGRLGPPEAQSVHLVMHSAGKSCAPGCAPGGDLNSENFECNTVERDLFGGRYRSRTDDLYGVKQIQALQKTTNRRSGPLSTTVDTAESLTVAAKRLTSVSRPMTFDTRDRGALPLVHRQPSDAHAVGIEDHDRSPVKVLRDRSEIRQQ